MTINPNSIKYIISLAAELANKIISTRTHFLMSLNIVYTCCYSSINMIKNKRKILLNNRNTNYIPSILRFPWPNNMKTVDFNKKPISSKLPTKIRTEFSTFKTLNPNFVNSYPSTFIFLSVRTVLNTFRAQKREMNLTHKNLNLCERRAK